MVVFDLFIHSWRLKMGCLSLCVRGVRLDGLEQGMMQIEFSDQPQRMLACKAVSRSFLGWLMVLWILIDLAVGQYPYPWLFTSRQQLISPWFLDGAWLLVIYFAGKTWWSIINLLSSSMISHYHPWPAILHHCSPWLTVINQYLLLQSWLLISTAVASHQEVVLFLLTPQSKVRLHNGGSNAPINLSLGLTGSTGAFLEVAGQVGHPSWAVRWWR